MNRNQERAFNKVNNRLAALREEFEAAAEAIRNPQENQVEIDHDVICDEMYDCIMDYSDDVLGEDFVRELACELADKVNNIVAEIVSTNEIDNEVDAVSDALSSLEDAVGDLENLI